MKLSAKNLSNNVVHNKPKTNYANLRAARPVAFGGRLSQESIGHGKKLIQETALFRDLTGLKFVQKYTEDLLQIKPQVVIYDGGCSSGEETYSIAMLLKNHLSKIKLTGFDLGSKAIETAKKGEIPISTPRNKYKDLFSQFSAFSDSFLAFDSEKPLNSTQKELKNIFESSFKENQTNSIKEFLQTKLNKKIDTKNFCATDEIKNNCNFLVGDITRLDELINDEDADILLFRNSLYHLTTNYSNPIMRFPKPENEVAENVSNIFKNIHKKLSKDGIVVMGNNEKFQTFDHLDIIPKNIEQQGFKPLLEENENVIVWKKI